MARVAVVTGSNQGIGFAAVRALCKNFKGNVYLTARSEEKGRAAVADLEKEGLKPCFHQLDITDHGSVVRLRDYLKDKYGGLDVLINNAAIAYKAASTAPFVEQTEVSMATNFTAHLDVCNTLFPILRDHARVVQLASMAAHMTFKQCSKQVKKQIMSCKTVEAVQALMDEFVQIARSGTVEERGWPKWGYGVTKIGVRLLVPIQQAALDADTSRKDIIVNCCCPGIVNTNMTSHNPNAISPDEGADTPVYLALLPPNTASNPLGKYLYKRTVEEWPAIA